MKRRNAFIITAWVFGVALLVGLLFQMQNYVSILNDTGAIRGQVQRAAKLEFSGQSEDEAIQRVDTLIATLESLEASRPIKDNATNAFIADLDAVHAQWDLMKDEMGKFDAGEGSTERLLAMSETQVDLADAMALSAQRRAERDFALTLGLCLALAMAAFGLMFLLDRDQVRRTKKALYTDSLTGQDNIMQFEKRAQGPIKAAAPGSFLVVYTNITNFRFINDAYGRSTGDQLISTLARIFAKACQEGELSARANADHFVLLLFNDPERVQTLSREVDRALKDNPALHFSELLSCSYGVCEVTDPNQDIGLLVGNATVALKEGKKVGGIAFFDECFRQTLALQDRIEHLMVGALRRCEFLPYLQPKVDLTTQEIVGAEALVRWDSPRLGFLPPDQFIPQFEKNGFIVDLDFFMLDRICHVYPLTTENDQTPLVISVNFSRVTILHNDFERRLIDTVDMCHIAHEHVELEITESVFTVDEDSVISILKSLKGKGFRLAMDDFGTGYSSLSLLRKLPIDVLKIDRGFLSKTESTDRMLHVLEGVVSMANALGIQTVCEGVETEEQAEMLRGVGCPIAQGYLYSKPLAMDEFKQRYNITEGH